MRQHLVKPLVMLAFVLALSGAGQEWVVATEAECEGDATRVKALSSGSQHTAVNFNTDVNGVVDGLGHFDAVPLLSTTIAVNGGPRKSSCLIAHLSAEVAPQDNHVMFQVLLDGVPMHGHGIFPYSLPVIQSPVVWDPEETDKNLNRMVAFNFFAAVRPGTHSVEVRWAGCCGFTNGNTTTIATVANAVLTLQYH
jgi:hypothetical protein